MRRNLLRPWEKGRSKTEFFSFKVKNTNNKNLTMSIQYHVQEQM